MLDDKRISELRALRGQGMVSAVGEYTPDELWEALDEIERLRTEQRDLMTRAAAEAWRWAVQAAKDNHNDQTPEEMPVDRGELIVQNVIICGR